MLTKLDIPQPTGIRLLPLFCIVLSFFLFTSCSVLQNHTSISTSEKLKAVQHHISSEILMESAFILFQKGDFENAALSWDKAALLYKKKGKTGEQCDALIKLSLAYQSIGWNKKAEKQLKLAFDLAEKLGNETLMAAALNGLGNTYIATGMPEKACRFLNQGLELAHKTDKPGLAAIIFNNLGNLLATQKKYNEAVSAYQKAILLANKVRNRSLIVIALANAAKASIKKEACKEAKALLNRAFSLSQSIADSHDKAFALINIGLACREFDKSFLYAGDYPLLLAFKSLNEAAKVAEDIGDIRAGSYAWGYLGHLYEDEKRYREALKLTRAAGFAAQRVNAPESLYLWQWQTGRLFKNMGRLDESISAYQRAVETIASIRQGISMGYGCDRPSFRESVVPMYYELVDLLLLKAASLEGTQQCEPYLAKAREIMELLKITELRDYFHDECVDALQNRITKLDLVSSTAVIIYPILFKDRIELLVSFPTGLKRFSVPVGVNVLTGEIRKFCKTLKKRTTYEYMPHAQKLYDWLIRPLEADIAQFPVDTLVFVPGGHLLTIPMAPLHDGKRFLINRFAVAVTPSLNLIDPLPINRGNISILAVGITESIQGFSGLPYVADELENIRKLYKTKILLNKNFLISKMEEALAEEPFNIVHIASHGKFDKNIENTFLLTFDGRLTLDRLDQCIGFFRFRDEPLELLTLSACETATSDGRAALGLAGISIKAGARSALATLWPINDQASSILITEFYNQLRDPSISKAMALQHAQLKLLKDLRYDHPGYWSPFLLINNWL